MKFSIFKKLGLSLAVSSILLIGCEKEENLDFPSSNNSSKITNTSNTHHKSGINPENSNNDMDYIGVYFQNMILEVNETELSLPSTTQSDYEGKFTSYLSDNDIGFDFSNMNFETSDDFFDAADNAIEYSILDTAASAVDSLIAFENAIVATSSLTQDQKTFLLSLSSAMKYTRATMANEGLVVGGQLLAANDLKLNPGCFDDAFRNGAKAGLSTLADGDNPVLAAAAWIGLPGTIIGSIGNGIWRGFSDC